MVSDRNPTARADEIGGLLQQFGAATEDLSRAFATLHGMHHTAARAIVELQDEARDGRAMTSGQLGAALGLTPAAVTALVDRMVAAGHVRREPDPADRRRVLLVVEDVAEELGERFFRPLADDLVAMMGDYTDTELELVRTFLRDAVVVIERHVTREA